MDIEIFLPEGAEDKIEIVELKTGTELAIEAPVKEVEVAVAGDSVLVGKPVIDSTVTVEAASNKETVELVLKTNSFKKSDIVFEKGAADINVKVGTFKKSTIDLSTGSAKDSIAFGGDTKIVKNDILLGAGKDTVTFAEGIKLKGDTKIKVGDGRDAIKVPEEVKGGGKLLISNFSKKDRLVVDGKKLSGNKLYKGKKEAPDFIAIEFEDGTVIS